MKQTKCAPQGLEGEKGRLQKIEAELMELKGRG